MMLAFSGCVHPTQSECWAVAMVVAILIAPLLYFIPQGEQEAEPQPMQPEPATLPILVAIVVAFAVMIAVVNL